MNEKRDIVKNANEGNQWQDGLHLAQLDYYYRVMYPYTAIKRDALTNTQAFVDGGANFSQHGFHR